MFVFLASTTVSCSRKRKQATTAAADDVLLGDSDSDDVGSSCSAPGQQLVLQLFYLTAIGH